MKLQNSLPFPYDNKNFLKHLEKLFSSIHCKGMKNPFNPRIFHPDRYDREGFVELVGFSGYHVDTFNHIWTYRAQTPRRLSVYEKKQGNYKVECLQLYDNDGVKRFVSRRKLLIETLGREEYQRREERRDFRELIEAEEERQLAKLRELEDEKRAAIFERETRAYIACNRDLAVFIEWQRLKHDPDAQDAWVTRKEAEKALGELF